MVIQHKGIILSVIGAILFGYCMGLIQGRTNPSPNVLSIDAMDYTWIDDLYQEAKSKGESVCLDHINRDDRLWYWLHSC